MVRLSAVRAAKAALLLITIIGGMGYDGKESHQAKEARQQPAAVGSELGSRGSNAPEEFRIRTTPPLLWAARTYENESARAGEEIGRRLRERLGYRDFDYTSCDYDHSDTFVFTVTAYTNGYESTQKKFGQKGYGITATGTHTKAGQTIAADWSVLPPGTKVIIEGLEGVYIVEDKGSAVKGNHIDLYIPRLKDAKAWGRQERSIIILEWGRLP